MADKCQHQRWDLKIKVKRGVVHEWKQCANGKCNAKFDQKVRAARPDERNN